jgi:hypothetical protein
LSTVLLLDLVLDVQLVGSAEQMGQNHLLSGPGVVARHLGATEGGLLFSDKFFDEFFCIDRSSSRTRPSVQYRGSWTMSSLRFFANALSTAAAWSDRNRWTRFSFSMGVNEVRFKRADAAHREEFSKSNRQSLSFPGMSF